MFQIYNGGTTFTQWTKGNKLIMDVLPVGADVLFYSDSYSDAPLKSDVYEITVDDETVKVCDVPNALLTKAEKIKVCVRSVVTGKYGVKHSMVGPREKYFEVEPADRPSDYVEDPVDTGGGLTKLPEGYPYKEKSEKVLVDEALALRAEGGRGMATAEWKFSFVVGNTYKVIYDNAEYTCVAQEYPGDPQFAVLGNMAVLGGGGTDTGEPFVLAGASGWYDVATESAGEHTIRISEYSETIHPIAPEFLPEGYPYKEGSKTVIEWNGNTDGLVSVPIAALGGTFYKVSDAAPGIADLIGGKYTVTTTGEKEIAEADLMEDGGVIMPMTPEFVVVLSDGASTSGFVFPEAGVYFIGSGDYYVSNLTYGNEIIHTMAPEFLPAGVGGGATSLYINTVPGTPICNLEQSKLVELFVDLTAAETAMDEMAMMDAFAAFPACLLMATVSNAPTMYYPDKKEYVYNSAGSTIIYVFSEAEKRVSLNADGTFTVS